MNRRNVVKFICFFTVAVAVLVLLGWTFNFPYLKSVVPGFVSMKVNTAISFMLSGLSVCLLETGGKKRVYLAKLLNIVVIGIAVLTSMEYIFGWVIGLDELFVKDDDYIITGYPFPGRMAETTSMCFLFINIGLLLVKSSSQWLKKIAQYSFHLVTAIALVAVVGYIFQIAIFYRFAFLSSMALHTSILFLVLSVAAANLNAHLGITWLFTGSGMGNVMVRRLFPLMVVVIVIAGYLRILTHRTGMVNVENGIALFALSFIFICLFLVWKTAIQLNRIDAKRAGAEAELKELNVSLEQKVKDRSRELKEVTDRLVLATSVSRIGIWDWDIKGNRLVWDKLMYELYGIDEKSVVDIYSAWSSCLHPDDLKRFEVEVDAARDAAQAYDTVFRINLNGVTKYIQVVANIDRDEHGAAVRMTGTNQDVTVLTKAKEKFESLLESAPDAMVIINADGEIELVNSQTEKLFGWDKEELIGKSIDTLVSKEAKEAGNWRGLFSVRQPAKQKGVEVNAETIDGRVFPVEVSMSPIETEDGMLVSAAIRDITERKRAEYELKESGKRNRIFVEQAPNAIAMFGTDMRYLAASKQWYIDYGLIGKDIIGLSHYDVFPEIGEDWKQIHRECMAGGVNKNDNGYFLRADGTEQWIVWDVRPWYLSDNEVGGILMYTADITERKRIERQLRLSEERFKGAFEHSATGMALLSVTGKCLQVNTAMTEMLGYTTEELLRCNFEDIIFTEDLVLGVKEHNSLLQGALPYYHIAKRLVHKDGHIVWGLVAMSVVSDDMGKPEYLTLQTTDITIQKQAQYQLEKALTEMKGLLDASTQVSIIGTDMYGVITSFNKGAENLLGYSSDEMVLKQNAVCLHDLDEVAKRSNELSKEMGRPVNGGEVFVALAKVNGFETREWNYVKKDGTRFPVQLTMTAVKDRDKIVGYLGIAADISEIKNIQKEMNVLLNVTKDQNERLKNFAHIVSHNLRSHSGNISVLLALLLAENNELEEIEMMGMLQLASANLKETIDNLTEVVQMNTEVLSNIVSIDLKHAVDAALQNVHALAREANVVLNNEVKDGHLVKGITAYVDSVIMNFLTNAIKYRSPERAAYVTVSSSVAGAYTILTIADNGRGIDMEKYGDRLFGMYKTFHGNSDARGVGLFITRNQIEALGGRIEVESMPGVGSTFNVYFKNGAE